MVPSDVGSNLNVTHDISLSHARWRISRGTMALDRTRTEVAMQVFPGIDTAPKGGCSCICRSHHARDEWQRGCCAQVVLLPDEWTANRATLDAP